MKLNIINSIAKIIVYTLIVIMFLFGTLCISDLINEVHIYIENQNHIINQLTANLDRHSRNLFKEHLEDILSAHVEVINFTKMHYGSGIFIAPNVLLTAKHLLEEPDDVLVVRKENTYLPAKILKKYEELDLLVLKLYAEDELFPYVKISEFEPIVADEVYAIGNPYQFKDHVTFGLIRTYSEKGLFYHSAFIAPGNSGGGLFNKDGDLVGINVAMILDKENLFMLHPVHNFGIAINIVELREELIEIIELELKRKTDTILDRLLKLKEKVENEL